MRVRVVALLASLAFLCSSVSAHAQAKPPAPTRKPAAPAAPAPKKVEPAPPVAVVAPPPAPTDVRFKTKYTTGDQVTESTTYIQGNRERYELGDMILLKQHDQKRTIQISRGANTYLVNPEGMPAPAAATPAAAPKPPGVVMIATTIVNTGESKAAFGQQARHVKTMIDRQPQPGACDQSKMRIETDAWYIDLPAAMATPPESNQVPPAATGCADEIKTTSNGDPKALGFPISYSTTFIEVDSKDSKPVVMAMEVTDFEVTKLDAALFEIPQGMTAALNPGELAKAVSNANEAKLASGAPMPQKKPGVVRVGVPEVVNKTTQSVDTRALRTRLIAQLEEEKIEAIPMVAGSPAELQTRATDLGVDYLLLAEITTLKASKPGGFTKVLKATAGEDAAKDITEAKMSVQLVPPGGKARLSTTTSGKDGGAGFKTGLGVAKFASSMYLRTYYMGGMYGSPMGALNTMRMMNMGGMGMLGNPALMQGGMGMGAMRMGMGLDPTAGAASYMMQQAMMGAAAAAGGQGGGPSFDSVLEEAAQDAGNNVVETLKKPVPAKK
jgi:hypothetical protein